MQPFNVTSNVNDLVVFSVDNNGNVIAAGAFTIAGGITGGLNIATGLTNLNDQLTIQSKNPNGALNILQSVATTGNPGTISISEAAATNGSIGLYVSGDSSARFTVRADGRIAWGPGNAPADTVLQRSAAGVLALSTGSLDVSSAGQGLRVAEGANAKQGTALLVAGTVTVANTAVTATSRIFLTSQVDGGTPGFLRVSTRVAGTSFTILSSSNTDTSTVAYEIFEVG